MVKCLGATSHSNADLVANVVGDLTGAPTVHAGDVELGKSTGGHLVMIAAANRTD